MPVPKRKRSRARRDSRFANKGITPKVFAVCANCTTPIMSHQACLECGFYKGKKVLNTKNERKLKRTQKHAEQAKASEESK